MHIDAYAAAKATAITEIGNKLDVDLSVQSLPKSSDPKILELFRLQKIAEYAGQTNVESDLLNKMLEKISNTKGVGPSLFKRIEKALKE